MTSKTQTGKLLSDHLALMGLADELALAVDRLAGLIDEQITPRKAGTPARRAGRRP